MGLRKHEFEIISAAEKSVRTEPGCRPHCFVLPAPRHILTYDLQHRNTFRDLKEHSCCVIRHTLVRLEPRALYELASGSRQGLRIRLNHVVDCVSER